MRLRPVLQEEPAARRYLCVCRSLPFRPSLLLFLAFLSFVIPKDQAFSQAGRTTRDLKKLTLEELMGLQVSTVSRQPVRLSESASAAQIITGEDIWRSTAMRLPEALRLAPNLQVAQSNSHDWAVTARGFNGAPLANSTLANKLLVMIDGRTIYTPLFGGVFWDVQHVFMEDVDRIEVVSGPGGTLWGANAVNGVINIVTRSAKDTQGGYVAGAAGSFLQDFGAARYGGSFGTDMFYRVYLQRVDQRSTKLRTGPDAGDAWNMTQSGFRMDYQATKKDELTFQGDFYIGDINESPSTEVNGQNIIGRWTRTFSAKSDVRLQVYFDRTWRKLPAAQFSEDLKTYDLDFQHRLPVGERNNILWGFGFRLMQDDVSNSPLLSFVDPRKDMHVFNFFVQDNISLAPERLGLTLGSKVERNISTNFEVQPSVRLAWTPNEKQTVWTAVSRAIHAPNRFDTDMSFPVVSDPDFKSEKVNAYELGYRVRPLFELSLSLAGFYNHYDDLRSLDFVADPGVFVFTNGHHADTWGFELSGNLQALDWWRLRGGYTYFDKDIETSSPNTVATADLIEGLDPKHQFLLQSMMNLPAHLQLDIIARYADSLPATLLPTAAVSDYFDVDAHLSWQFRDVEISVAGQNLIEERHREFGTQIPRSISGRIAWHF